MSDGLTDLVCHGFPVVHLVTGYLDVDPGRAIKHNSQSKESRLIRSERAPLDQHPDLLSPDVLLVTSDKLNPPVRRMQASGCEIMTSGHEVQSNLLVFSFDKAAREIMLSYPAWNFFY